MKICSNCKLEKLITEFSKCTSATDGLKYQCKTCLNSSYKNYREKNKEKVKNSQRKCISKNPDKYKEMRKLSKLKNKQRNSDRDKLYRQINIEKFKEKERLYRIENAEKIKKSKSEYKKRNRGKINAATAKRWTSKLKATPKWITKEHLVEIENLYIEAKRLESIDSIPRHVDHIIPLQGKIVSGLHVPWNLAITTAEDNIKKGNKLL